MCKKAVKSCVGLLRPTFIKLHLLFLALLAVNIFSCTKWNLYENVFKSRISLTSMCICVKSRLWFVILNLNIAFKLSTHSSQYFVISSMICFLFWWCNFHPHIEPTQDHNMLMFSFSIFSQCVVSKWENLNITFIIALINFSSFH